MLFGVPITEYSELGELNKVFEPFFDLWDCAEKWLSNKETWFLLFDEVLISV